MGSVDIIQTNLQYGDILKGELFRGIKIFLIPNAILVLVMIFTSDDSFLWFVVVFNIILFLFILELFINKRSRILYSIKINEHEFIIKYFYLFSIRTTTLMPEDITVEYYYKQYGRNAILTLEFKHKNVIFIEIRDVNDYGWNYSKRKDLISFIQLYVGKMDDRSNVPVKKWFGKNVRD